MPQPVAIIMAGDCGISCPVDGGYFSYSPSIAGNAILLALFSLLLPVTLYMGYLFRPPFFSAVLATGLAFDVVGFAGRVLLHGDRASQTYFTLSMLGTVLGPTFTAAAIFVVLPHVLAVYGDHLSPCRPSFVEAGLCSLTCVALVIELVGVLFVVYSFRDVPVSWALHTIRMWLTDASGRRAPGSWQVDSPFSLLHYSGLLCCTFGLH